MEMTSDNQKYVVFASYLATWLGNQSQHNIGLILTAYGASHIINFSYSLIQLGNNKSYE